MGDESIQETLQETIKTLTAAAKTIIIDDRNTSFGTKANDADLLGIPHRLILSPKSLEKGGLEYKHRTSSESKIITNISEIL